MSASYSQMSMSDKDLAPRPTRNKISSLKPDDIEDLKASVGCTVVVRGQSPDDVYQDAVARWNRFYTKQAGIIVYPTTEEEVATVLRFVGKHRLDLAVAGGRHSYHGASSVEDGLVIDMRHFRTVRVDKDARVVTAGGGCRAEDVEGPAAKEGLHVVFGAVNDTGIGGLSLGGGVGMLSGQFGLAVDNIIGLRVVLASGEVVTANADENPELFWAMCGAGGNFGIVMEFQFRGHPHRQPGGMVYFGILAYPMEKMKTLISTTNRMYDEAVVPEKGRLALMFALMRGPGAPQHMPAMLVFYDGTEEEAKTAAKPLFDLEPVAVMGGPQPYTQTTNLGKMMPDGDFNRHYATGDLMDFPLREDVILAAIEHFLDVVKRLGDAAQKCMFMVEARLGSCVVTRDRSAIAYASRWPRAGVLGPNFQWADASLDGEMTAEVKKLSAILLDGIKKHRVAALADGQVVNGGIAGSGDIDGEAVHPTLNAGDRKIGTIFGPNVQRLRELKRRFDPDSMFDKWYYVRPAEA